MKPEDLQPFCCDDTSKSNISQPWSDGDFSYATDGHVMIRVPRIETISENSKAPDVTRLAPFFDAEPAGWFPVTTLEVPKMSCPHCGGTGKVYECPECEGEGEVELETDWNSYDEQECKSCKGDGKISAEKWERMKRRKPTDSECECDRCWNGQIFADVVVEYGGSNFTGRLVSRVAALPNAEIGPAVDPLSTARFRFDGGDGLIMPRR